MCALSNSISVRITTFSITQTQNCVLIYSILKSLILNQRQIILLVVDLCRRNLACEAPINSKKKKKQNTAIVKPIWALWPPWAPSCVCMSVCLTRVVTAIFKAVVGCRRHHQLPIRKLQVSVCSYLCGAVLC